MRSPWLRVASAAASRGRPRQRLYRLTARGEIPRYKQEGRLLFRRDELDAWLSPATRREGRKDDSLPAASRAAVVGDDNGKATESVEKVVRARGRYLSLGRPRSNGTRRPRALPRRDPRSPLRRGRDPRQPRWKHHLRRGLRWPWVYPCRVDGWVPVIKDGPRRTEIGPRQPLARIQAAGDFARLTPSDYQAGLDELLARPSVERRST